MHVRRAPQIISFVCCVQGLDDEYQEEGKLLGNYIYQEDGESLQTFPVMVTVKIMFRNNLGVKVCNHTVNSFHSYSGAKRQDLPDH